MKRCNRFLNNNSEPYQEYSFEQSLRKYPPTPAPNKQQRHNSLPRKQHPIHSLPHITQPQQQKETVLDAKDKREEVVMIRDESKEAVGVMPINMAEGGHQGEKMESGEASRSDWLENKEKENAPPPNILSKPNDGPPTFEATMTLAIDHTKLHQQSFEDSISPMLDANDPYLTNPDHLNLFLPSFSSILDVMQEEKQQGEEKSSMLGGRFHLNSKIFISRRTLRRMARRYSEERLLEKLLKDRAYLWEQREQIAARLREFLQQQ